MLLSHPQLVGIVLGRGYVTGVPLTNVNAASIDITLGDTLLIEEPPIGNQVVSLRDRDSLKTREFKFRGDLPYYLHPGQFILAHSVEVFNLPNWISADYSLKSSMARIGLEHLKAGWCDAGWHGSVLTLELKNVSEHHVIALHKGDKIGQLKFFAHEPVGDEASYATRGSYNKLNTVSSPLPERGTADLFGMQGVTNLALAKAEIANKPGGADWLAFCEDLDRKEIPRKAFVEAYCQMPYEVTAVADAQAAVQQSIKELCSVLEQKPINTPQYCVGLDLVDDFDKQREVPPDPINLCSGD